jgi:integrase
MARIKLTDRKLNSLKPKASHYDIWDADTPGLGVRVSVAGRKTFVLMTRYPGSSNPTRRALGIYGAMTLAEAREKAREWIKLIQRRIDPADEEEAKRQAAARLQANTFAAVAEDYLRLHVFGPDPDHPRQRKAVEVSRNFRRVFVNEWGERLITDITRRDVRELIEHIRDRAPVQARNLLAYLKTFYKWAITRDMYGVENSPCEYLKGADIIGGRVSSERILSDDELVAFWRATGDMGYPYGPVYRMLLLTGLRLNEVARARWSEIDLPKGIWVIPPERMKGRNGKARPHSVPLTTDVLAILNSLPRFDCDYVFTFDGRRPVDMSDKLKKRLDTQMRKLLGKDLPPWVNHDLRRTLRSGLSELRVNTDVAEAILAHAKAGIRGVYDRYEYFDEKRFALEAWATRLRSIVEPQPPNVVELAKART